MQKYIFGDQMLKLQHSLSPAFIGPSIALIIFLSAILRSSSFFFVIVIVSASYINIGRIIVVYIFIFVFFPNILLFNTFLLAWKALFADCIFASISVSLTPVFDTITPRYLNFSTTSKLNPPILILSPTAFLPSLIIFVLSSFSFNPIFPPLFRYFLQHLLHCSPSLCYQYYAGTGTETEINPYFSGYSFELRSPHRN